MLESVCQVCHSRPASSHLLEMKPDGACLELHICSYCIAELSLDLRTDPPAIENIVEAYEPSTSFHYAQPAKDGGAAHHAVVRDNPTCPTCGLTWSEFRRDNRFGCPDDYRCFGGAAGSGLDPLLLQLHGANRHCGRVPSTTAANDERQLLARKRKLEQRLQTAIAREDFEQAATLRDQIRDLLGGNGS